jgi:hypothetical protein
MTADLQRMQRAHGWRPYIADRITVARNGQPFASFLAPLFCEFQSGPSLFALVDTCAAEFGPGTYYMISRRRIGIADPAKHPMPATPHAPTP